MLNYEPKTSKELRAQFEKPLSAYPETTVVSVYDGIDRFDVEIPTAEVYTPGSWLSRRFSGVTFTSVEKWLAENTNHFVKTITMG